MLRHLTFYTRHFRLFSSCGTMFPFNLLNIGHVAAWNALDASASTKARRCDGLWVHERSIRTRAVNWDLSDAFDDSPGDTWTHHDHPMKIQRMQRSDTPLHTRDMDAS